MNRPNTFFEITIVLIALGAGAIAWLHVGVVREQNQRARSEGHAIHYTHLMINDFEAAIVYFELDNKFPCELSVLPTNVPASVMYSALAVSDPERPQLLSHWSAWDEKRTLFDIWHNEFHFQVKRVAGSTNEGEVFIWSNGPNQKDEEGGGDDITDRFQVSLPAEVLPK